MSVDFDRKIGSPVSGKRARLLGLGILLFVIGAKLGVIHNFGTDQPFADQWAAEGVGFLQAPLHGDFNWNSFFWPHGEHRPAVTRLITRGLILANGGQWDCYVEIVFNLLIYAALLVVAWRIALQITGGVWVATTAAFMAALFSAPCAYENLLWGFQSQFIFLILCGLFHVYGTMRSGRLDRVWWMAQLAGLCGLFSIAAGLMSAAALGALTIFEIARGRRDAWVWFTLVVNAVLFVYGWWLLPAGITSPGDRLGHLFQAVVRTGYLLSWPLSGLWWSFLFQAPWIVCFIFWCRGRKDWMRDRLVSALGIWILFAAFAVGYGRVLTSATIGVRYYDVLILGLFVNALGLIRILAQPWGRVSWVWRPVALSWLIGISIGLRNFNNPAFAGAMLREQKVYASEQTRIIREFLVTDDVRPLEAFEHRTHRFPHFQLTLGLLRDTTVSSFLPPSLATDGRVGPLSRLAPLVSASWMIWLGTGLLLLLAAGLKGGRVVASFRVRGGDSTIS